MIGAPLPSEVPDLVPNSARQVDVSTTGVKLSYTVPAVKDAILTSASYASISGTNPNAQLRYTPSGGSPVVFGVATAVIQIQFGFQFPLDAGDVVDWNISSAAAASTADFTIGIQEQNLQPRVTLSFLGPAILDQGITIYSGLLPLLLLSEWMGGAIREEVHVIGNIAGISVPVVDIFYP